MARTGWSLPIGLLPGTVQDAPTAGPVKSGAKKQPPPPRMTGGQLATAAFEHLREIAHSLKTLVQLAESRDRIYLMVGSVAGGGTIGTTPATVLQANNNRNGLSVQNTGASGNLTVGLGVTAPQSGSGIVLLPGTSWDGRVSGQMFKGSISLVGSTSGVTYSWLEA